MTERSPHGPRPPRRRPTRACASACSTAGSDGAISCMTAADLAYETDAWGRFVFVTPDPALGWSAATLIGQPAELLLAGGTGANGFNPFRVTVPVRRRRAWLQRADGSPVLLAFSAAPLLDAEGAHRGHARHGHRLDRVRRRAQAGRRGAAPRRGAGSHPVAHGPGGAGAADDAGGAGRADERARRRGRRGDRRAAARTARCWCTAPAAAPMSAGRGGRVAAQRRAARRMPSPRTGGRSWSRPVTRGSAPMPASRCGARPGRVAGTARTSC